MPDRWFSTTLESEDEAIQVLTELQGMRWLSRGQAERYNNLTPSIDRDARDTLAQAEMLKLERQSIDIFRSTARFFADEGERSALQKDIGALMVLRYYGTPTRLLDWSQSPFVSAYFAVSENDSRDGEIWDGSNGNMLKINSTKGQYLFTRCEGIPLIESRLKPAHTPRLYQLAAGKFDAGISNIRYGEGETIRR